jgi:hypothetical protein
VELPEWGRSLGFGLAWVVRVVWGLVWRKLVAEWSVGVSMGVAWLGDSIV